MPNLAIRSFQPEDENEVIHLWGQCGLIVPQNNPQKDIKRKMKVNPELFLVGIYRSNLIATCIAGYEGHRGWINYLAVAPAMRRRGVATQLMTAAEKQLKCIGCPKINLQVRTSNKAVIDFYASIGFQDDHVLSMGKRLEPE